MKNLNDEEIIFWWDRHAPSLSPGTPTRDLAEMIDKTVAALREKVAREKEAKPGLLCIAGGTSHRIVGLSFPNNVIPTGVPVPCYDCGQMMPAIPEAKPKRPSLEEMIHEIIGYADDTDAYNRSPGDDVQTRLSAAADILRALREDTIPEIRGMAKDCNTSAASAWADARLRALGEVP